MAAETDELSEPETKLKAFRMDFFRVRFTSLIFPGLAICMLAAVATLSVARPAAAQADLDGSLLSSDQRDELFEEVAAEYVEIQRRGNLLKKVVRLVKPTVVHIEAKKTEAPDSRGRTRTSEEAGSGVIVQHNNRFFIVTNRHVIRDSTHAQIKIRLADGRVLYPTQTWDDRGTDVAVMAISGTGLIAARIGDSDSLEIGDFVLAVGSPFGLSHSITYGIISAKGRRDLKLGDGSVRYQNFLQTDAAINPGNSGGPLINMRGEIVGINTAIASSSGGNDGIGFTIPINMAINIAKQLIDDGTVKRAYLGVHLDSRFNAVQAAEIGLPRVEGARVSGITQNSPAHRAELQVGDVILKVNNSRIEDDSHLVNLISVTPVGKEITLYIFRNGKTLAVKTKVGDRGVFESE